MIVNNNQSKCTKCGSTSIMFEQTSGKLLCQHCRNLFTEEKIIPIVDEIELLEEKIISSGAKDIQNNSDQLITLKCSSCAAEVVINTGENLQIKCHWCRSILSVNEQISNGAIPDMILPFKINKEEAQKEIGKLVKKRSFFAHPRFKKEFCTENINGVFLPYLVTSVNANASYRGESQKKDIERAGLGYRLLALHYKVQSTFNITINNLMIEACGEKLQYESSTETNNVINAILPFDVENSVAWNANYLKGYNSEKRNINIDEINDYINLQFKDISRHKGNELLSEYDRGTKWEEEKLFIRGQTYKSAYCPIWLYSYQSVNGGKKVLHYVALNARTKKAMGSIPINMKRLLFCSLIIQIIATIIVMSIVMSIINLFLANPDLLSLSYFLIIPLAICLLILHSGFSYYNYIKKKYSNYEERYYHEKTKSVIHSSDINAEFYHTTYSNSKSNKLPKMKRANHFYITAKRRSEYLSDELYGKNDPALAAHITIISKDGEIKEIKPGEANKQTQSNKKEKVITKLLILFALFLPFILVLVLVLVFDLYSLENNYYEFTGANGETLTMKIDEGWETPNTSIFSDINTVSNEMCIIRILFTSVDTSLEEVVKANFRSADINYRTFYSEMTKIIDQRKWERNEFSAHEANRMMDIVIYHTILADTRYHVAVSKGCLGSAESMLNSVKIN